MKEYYIHVDGKKLGPFSPEDLQDLHVGPDTLLSRTGMEWPVAAGEIEALRPLFKKEQQTRRDAAIYTASDTGHSQSSKERVGSRRVMGNSMRIIIMILLVAIVGTAIYYLTRESYVAREQDNVSVIHEREVLKAIRELKAEKIAKKAAEQRRKLLKARMAELQSLNVQLRQVSTRQDEAWDELDDIRRPRLFRSRSRKEAQLSEQQQVIDRLEAKAASLRGRISRCQAAIDSLSVDPGS